MGHSRDQINTKHYWHGARDDASATTGLQHQSPTYQSLIWTLQRAPKSKRIVVCEDHHRPRANIHTKVLQIQNQLLKPNSSVEVYSTSARNNRLIHSQIITLQQHFSGTNKTAINLNLKIPVPLRSSQNRSITNKWFHILKSSQDEHPT